MKQNGFVLVAVMLMMTVMTALIIANMRWILLYKKRYQDLQRFQAYSLQFEEHANALAQQFDGHPSTACVSSSQNTASLKQEIGLHGCKFANDYRYMVQAMGDYPCVRFNSELSTQHWLLSAMDQHLPHRVLQFRIATPIPVQYCVKKQIVMIEESILTRHWIVGF